MGSKSKVIAHTWSVTMAMLYDAHLDKLDASLDFETLTESEMLIWEVFFDHKVEGETKGRRIDPLILDLNRDSKYDITEPIKKAMARLMATRSPLTLIHHVNLGAQLPGHRPDGMKVDAQAGRSAAWWKGHLQH